MLIRNAQRMVAGSSEIVAPAGTTGLIKANLPNAMPAMTAFKAGSADFGLIIDGDSVLAGQGSNGVIGSNVAGSRNNMKATAWPTKLDILLNAAGVNATHCGWSGHNNATSYAELLTSDTRMTNGGTGSGCVLGPFPCAGGGVLRHNDTTQTFIFTFPQVTDNCVIQLMSYSGAVIVAYSVNGGAESTFNLNNATRFVKQITIPFASNVANNFVTIRASTAALFPVGCWGYSTVNKGIRIHNRGACGGISDDAVFDSGASKGEEWGNMLNIVGAKLAINAFGLNDQGARPDPTTSGASISTWIDRVRLTGCDPILLFPHSRSSGPGAVQLAYQAKWQAVAAAKNCPLIDMTYTYNDLGAWQAAGFDSGDGLHPNGNGAGFYASTVYAVLQAIRAAA